MNTTHRHTLIAFAGIALLVAGCSTTPSHVTSPYQPGPTVGHAIGATAGVIAGNVAGLGVGVVEGAIGGVASTFDPTTRVVRRWKTVTTSDGRTIQVPDDILVDRNGNPVLFSRPVKKPEQKNSQPDNNFAP